MKKGFSLVELIITIVILAIAIPGTLTILGGMTRRSHDAEKQVLALAYGRMRMEQILSKRFSETTPATPTDCNAYGTESSFGPDAGENETNYDDVDDFITTTPGNFSFDGEIDQVPVSPNPSPDPLADRGLKTDIQVRFVTMTFLMGSSYELESCGTMNCASSCYKRILVRVLDEKTNQELARVKTFVTPFK